MSATPQAKHIFTAKILNVTDLPPIQFKEKQDTCQQISQYLLNLIQRKMQVGHCCVLLPSIYALAKFFNRSFRVIRNALRNLEKEGIEAVTPNITGQISLWSTREPAMI